MKRELSKPYIMLDGEGVVRNIAMFMDFETANKIARAVYGDDAVAEEYKWLVAVGDKRKNGIYYVIDDDGTEELAKYIPSDEEKINDLVSDNNTLSEQLTEAQLALTEQYEANLSLEDEVTNTQLALTELYELKED